MVMSTRNGQTINVVVTASTNVLLTGSATADFIKPGVAVEFTAEVDKNHVVAEKVTSLTVVTLTTERPAGLGAEGSERHPRPKDNFGFVAPGGGGADAVPAEKATQKAEKHKAAAAISLPATVVVRGQVRTFKAGKLIVKTGKVIVKADVADDARLPSTSPTTAKPEKATPSRSAGVRSGRE